jgi:hypothetical protein
LQVPSPTCDSELIQSTTSRPSRCRRKSSRSLASSLASTPATVRHPARRSRYAPIATIQKLCGWRLTRSTEVTPRTPAPRISRRKGFLSKRTAFVREITKEVAGYVTARTFAEGLRNRSLNSVLTSRVCSLAPYEKRIIELLRNSKDKRARRLAKKRVRLSHQHHNTTDLPLAPPLFTYEHSLTIHSSVPSAAQRERSTR